MTKRIGPQRPAKIHNVADGEDSVVCGVLAAPAVGLALHAGRPPGTHPPPHLILAGRR